MGLIKFQDYPDTSTPLNAENLNNNFNEILNLLCPVGKVEVFFDNNDHSNHLGFTWERTSIGRVPVGINPNEEEFNWIGKTGGEKTHTLTRAEMPSHQHLFKFTKQINTPATGNEDIYFGSARQWNMGNNNNITEPEGGDAAHNNLQPYEVMAFWKRVS